MVCSLELNLHRKLAAFITKVLPVLTLMPMAALGGGACPNVEQRLLASDPDIRDGFGNSMDADGDTIVVGSLYEDELWEWQCALTTPGAGWIQASRADYILDISAAQKAVDACCGDGCPFAIIRLSDGTCSGSGYGYGLSPTISDVTKMWVKKASLARTATHYYMNVRKRSRGSAYVFSRTGHEWSQVAKLTPQFPIDTGTATQFGKSVSVSGNTIVVGCPECDAKPAGINYPSAGLAFVYTKAVDGTWAQDQILTKDRYVPGMADGERFGYPVRISGDTIAVGSYADPYATYPGMSKIPSGYCDETWSADSSLRNTVLSAEECIQTCLTSPTCRGVVTGTYNGQANACIVCTSTRVLIDAGGFAWATMYHKVYETYLSLTSYTCLVEPGTHAEVAAASDENDCKTRCNLDGNCKGYEYDSSTCHHCYADFPLVFAVGNTAKMKAPAYAGPVRGYKCGTLLSPETNVNWHSCALSCMGQATCLSFSFGNDGTQNVCRMCTNRGTTIEAWASVWLKDGWLFGSVTLFKRSASKFTAVSGVTTASSSSFSLKFDGCAKTIAGGVPAGTVSHGILSWQECAHKCFGTCVGFVIDGCRPDVDKQCYGECQTYTDTGTLSVGSCITDGSQKTYEIKVYESKVGRGDCSSSLIEQGTGFTSEASVQIKCDQLPTCVFYTWSQDPGTNLHEAWFCHVDTYDSITNAATNPLWRVGRQKKDKFETACTNENFRSVCETNRCNLDQSRCRICKVGYTLREDWTACEVPPYQRFACHNAPGNVLKLADDTPQQWTYTSLSECFEKCNNDPSCLGFLDRSVGSSSTDKICAWKSSEETLQVQDPCENDYYQKPAVLRPSSSPSPPPAPAVCAVGNAVMGVFAGDGQQKAATIATKSPDTLQITLDWDDASPDHRDVASTNVFKDGSACATLEPYELFGNGVCQDGSGNQASLCRTIADQHKSAVDPTNFPICQSHFDSEGMSLNAMTVPEAIANCDLDTSCRGFTYGGQSTDASWTNKVRLSGQIRRLGATATGEQCWRKKAPAPTPVVAVYTEGPFGDSACPTGYLAITTLNACNAARIALGKSDADWSAEGDNQSPGRLPYCWIGDTGKANFNRFADTASSSVNSKLICQREALNCLKIETFSAYYSDGTLNVEVDSGSGLTQEAQGTHAVGVTVLEKCYANTIKKVGLQNPTNNAWMGSVHYSRDGGISYNDLLCMEKCTGSTRSSTQLVVSGDANAAGMHPTECLNGEKCLFEANVIESQLGAIPVEDGTVSATLKWDEAAHCILASEGAINALPPSVETGTGKTFNQCIMDMFSAGYFYMQFTDTDGTCVILQTCPHGYMCTGRGGCSADQLATRTYTMQFTRKAPPTSTGASILLLPPSTLCAHRANCVEIKTQSECFNLAQDLGIGVSNSDDARNDASLFPPGCFLAVDTNKREFNTQMGGTYVHANYRPVCSCTEVTPDSQGFVQVGKGYCRPPELCEGVPDNDCKVNGFFKASSNAAECRNACESKIDCIGYSICSAACADHGNVCFMHTAAFADADWEGFAKLRKPYWNIGRASGDLASTCYAKVRFSYHKKITASIPEYAGYFSRNLDFDKDGSGNLIVASFTGSVHIIQRIDYQTRSTVADVASVETWSPMTKLTLSNCSSSPYIAKATGLSVNGFAAAVGCPREAYRYGLPEEGTYAGQLHLFTKGGGTWASATQEVIKQFPSDHEGCANPDGTILTLTDQFPEYMSWQIANCTSSTFSIKGGWHTDQCCIPKGTVWQIQCKNSDSAVGRENGAWKGAVVVINGKQYCRNFNAVGGAQYNHWVEPDPTIGMRFGWSIALRQHALVVGAPGSTSKSRRNDPEWGPGAVYIFTYSDSVRSGVSTRWAPSTKLTAPLYEDTMEFNVEFGLVVSHSGAGHIAAAAPQHYQRNMLTGNAFVYRSSECSGDQAYGYWRNLNSWTCPMCARCYGSTRRRRATSCSPCPPGHMDFENSDDCVPVAPVKCANAGETCACMGTVRFGTNASWSTWLDSHGSVECSVATFGDPDPGAAKTCECVSKVACDPANYVGQWSSPNMEDQTFWGAGVGMYVDSSCQVIASRRRMTGQIYSTNLIRLRGKAGFLSGREIRWTDGGTWSRQDCENIAGKWLDPGQNSITLTQTGCTLSGVVDGQQQSGWAGSTMLSLGSRAGAYNSVQQNIVWENRDAWVVQGTPKEPGMMMTYGGFGAGAFLLVAGLLALCADWKFRPNIDPNATPEEDDDGIVDRL